MIDKEKPEKIWKFQKMTWHVSYSTLNPMGQTNPPFGSISEEGLRNLPDSQPSKMGQLPKAWGAGCLSSVYYSSSSP